MVIATDRPRIGDVLTAARRRLREAPFEVSPREAMLLLAHVSKLGEVHLLSHPQEHLSREVVDRFERLLDRRLQGEPVAYLTGRREFFGRTFEVDERVLVPRPETEHLIETVLGLSLPRRARLLDIGTGSGCLAVTLAAELPGAEVTATDRSIGALAVAAGNARRHGVGARVRLLAADLVSALDLSTFDAAVTNPPYIAPAERATLPPEVRDFEPAEALFAPPGELGLVRRLLEGLEALRSGTPVMIELGLGQADRLAAIVQGRGFELVEVVPDYAGIARIALLHRSTPTS